jgi:hypothetical protein
VLSDIIERYVPLVHNELTPYIRMRDCLAVSLSPYTKKVHYKYSLDISGKVLHGTSCPSTPDSFERPQSQSTTKSTVPSKSTRRLSMSLDGCGYWREKRLLPYEPLQEKSRRTRTIPFSDDTGSRIWRCLPGAISALPSRYH